jgi:hypothetical protein
LDLASAQAVEKSLKAFLTWHERTFRRTHDLEELGKDCQAIDPTLAALLEEPTSFPITRGSCVTLVRPTHPNGRRRRPCSASQAAFSGICRRGSRWRRGFPKIMAITDHESDGNALEQLNGRLRLCRA